MNMRVFSAIIILILFAGCNARVSKTVFPEKEWKKTDPEKAGFNMQALAQIDSLMKKAEANGVLIYKGYLIAEWNYGGDANKRFEVQSITKSVTGAVLGLALKDGLIGSLDSKVKEFYPDFEVGPYTDEITFRHLITASSGIKSTITKGRYYDPGNMKPGIESRYHNDHLHQVATALTYIYGKDLGEVFNERILIPINAQDTMKWNHHNLEITCANGNKVKVVGGYAFSNWTARDLARVGYLYLNDGKWKEEQLLPHEYAKECRIPISIPVMDMNPNASSDKQSKSKYGLAWREIPNDQGNTIWYMSGNGGQFCVVMSEYNLVMTKINSYQHKPYTGIEQFEELLWNIFSEQK